MLTVRPTGTEPGCHVAVARPSIVATFPATPLTTVCEPVKTGGSGAAATIDDMTEWADAEPPAPEAVTTSSSVAPRSSGVGV